jgi:ABC-2 type transport system ATP-binding protein
VEKAIETVGLTPEANKKIGQLSKGYKQRVGLAAALIHDPEVLILDEPTSGLDPNQIIEIREVIRRQGQEKTILFSSHILQEVEAICDRVIIINKGQLVADDTLQGLKNSQAGIEVVIVQFKETVDTDTLAQLRPVENIEPVLIPSGSQFRIETTESEAIRKQLFALAVEKGFNIISLQSESNKLEDVFRQLTGNTADR